MATQVLSRKERGSKIASEDIVEINKMSYFVKSQSGKSGYAVTRAGQSWVCDCPDHKYRQVECKHIHAVVSQLTPKMRFTLNLWEASQ
jgi:putative transposase